MKPSGEDTLRPFGPRRLSVFLCHSSGDKPKIRALYKELRAAGCKPWLDELDIPGGVRWEDAIEDAVKVSDVVIACVSDQSVTKEGYLQKELRLALAVAEEKPDGTIYIVPLRLNDCEVPRKLRDYQWIDYFGENAFERLLESLARRAEQIGAVTPTLATPVVVNKSARGAYERANEAAEFVRLRTALRPKVGMILGAGLADFAGRLTRTWSVDSDKIPNFPLPPGRVSNGRLIVGSFGAVPMAVMVGRLHAYEGLRPDEVVFPVRLFARLGIRTILFSAAVGSINPNLTSGSLVVVSDHINQLGSNPLGGPTDDRFGSRFPDMSEVYSNRLRTAAIRAAEESGFDLPEAVLLAHSGPTYETPAEIRAMRILGADVVAMSTVPEAMAARQMGLEVVALCAVTNQAAGVPVEGSAADHEEILAAGRRMKKNFESLIERLMPVLAD